MFRLKLVIIILIFSVQAFASEDVLSNNPGYFETPGFIALGGTQIYSGSGTSRDKDVRPFVLGMYNVVQSEYGNIGLSVGSLFSTPSKSFNNSDLNFRLTNRQVTGELGLNYMTASQTFNFWLGAGYNITYVSSTMRNINNGTSSKSGNLHLSDSVYGWHYYMGVQYYLSNTSRWALFFLFRGQETNRARFNINKDITFSDGTTGHYNKDFNMNLNNKTYIFGLTYSF